MGSMAAKTVRIGGWMGTSAGTHLVGSGRPEPLRCVGMSPIWIWMQGAIVVCVLAAMVIAIVKLS
ncbi:MAG: hypothetical protein QOH12_3261 [Solirubrobacteraceae bacterium]|nr:hypothetical protein [Solirubrobacteraceae bacterium]